MRRVLLVAFLGIAACQGELPADNGSDVVSAAITAPTTDEWQGKTGPITPAPGTPQIGNSDGFTATINWTCAGNADAYRLMRLVSGQDSNWTIEGVPTVCGFTTNHLWPGLQHCYKIVALNEDHTATSGTGCFVAPPRAPYFALKSLQPAHVTLELTDHATNESAFTVYRRVNSGAWAVWQTRGPIAGSGSKVTFADDLALGGTKYSYKVTVSDSAGHSSESGTVQVTSGPQYSAAPTDVVWNDIDRDRVRLHWLHNDTREDYFNVCYRANGGVEQCEQAPAGNGHRSYLIDGLVAGTAYTAQVKAHNVTGDGVSAMISFTTWPAGRPDPAWPNDVDIAFHGGAVWAGATAQSFSVQGGEGCVVSSGGTEEIDGVINVAFDGVPLESFDFHYSHGGIFGDGCSSAFLSLQLGQLPSSGLHVVEVSAFGNNLQNEIWFPDNHHRLIYQVP